MLGIGNNSTLPFLAHLSPLTERREEEEEEYERNKGKESERKKHIYTARTCAASVAKVAWLC